jgi:hypothetical protein
MHCLMLYYHALLVSRKYHCSCQSLVLAAGMQIVLPCMCVQCVSIKVPLQVGMTSGVRVCARAALQRWNELVGRGGRRSRVQYIQRTRWAHRFSLALSRLSSCKSSPIHRRRGQPKSGNWQATALNLSTLLLCLFHSATGLRPWRNSTVPSTELSIPHSSVQRLAMNHTANCHLLMLRLRLLVGWLTCHPLIIVVRLQ